MGDAVENLKNLVGSKDCYDIPLADLLPRQIEAANELLQERLGEIKLLANRAEETGVREIRNTADIVPLLFAHTSYKSYPESWFTQGKWDRMGRWLDTLTTHRVPKIDTADIKDVDEWVERMAEVGHHLSCSSGTTGKCSIIPSHQSDRDFSMRAMTQALTWSTGIPPIQQFKGFAVSPRTKNPRIMDCTRALAEAFMTDERAFPGDTITVGQVNRMVGLRRSIADGTAKPGDIAAFETLAKSREEGLEAAIQGTAEAIIAARGDKIFLQGMLATMWKIAERVREMGYGGKDFGPDKLDETGDELIEPGEGEIEGRAAFFDMSTEDRWAGVITGDKISADFGRCACGHQGPTVGDQIVRYADLPGGDKITCAGTIDAYVRGAA